MKAKGGELRLDLLSSYPCQCLEQLTPAPFRGNVKKFEDLLTGFLPCAQIQVAWIKLLVCHQQWQKWHERSWDKHIDLSKQEQHISILFILEGVLSQQTLTEEVCFLD